jgi:multicomponent Na+:H+ antiporter subunit D
VALLSDAGRTGGVLHLVGHAFAKITLFFAVGSVYLASGRTAVNELRGIGRQMRWTMGAFVIGALSIVGLPPTVGFIAKYFLFLGAADAGQWLVIAVLAVSTVLSAGYYLRVMRVALLESPAPLLAGGSGGDPSVLPKPSITESPALVVGPLVVTAAVTLLLGIAPGPLLELIRAAARVP